MATSKGYYMGVPVWLKSPQFGSSMNVRRGAQFCLMDNDCRNLGATSERLCLEPLPFLTVDTYSLLLSEVSSGWWLCQNVNGPHKLYNKLFGLIR